ncbi:GmrSD restriction endonuclease domain-containing protein [Mucilaginibacter kameinonensis]|uniref:GmrSD restriction endonuclease domain-containing protein n=1 Tax=Mucilaginibacter kameinonensis TaxID=452286 RepID=UPI000EF81D8A|nr:DUF262 domain-containing protein [Mucilaginibacter kameinonensis]
MSLIKEIDDKKKEISTDGYPMSIGELISLYKEDALDVHPEFQRFFRWSILQKSKLIESLLLGIPIPSIFVSQRKNGVWDVVDGQQRLSTILEFVGELKDLDGNLLPPSTLVKTTYLPSLDGMTYKSGDDNHRFSQDLQFIFKREKLDIKIVKRESDENVKYELFQRLNTLGSKLSDQEVRNCLLVMIKPDFYEWLIELAKFDPFLEVISLADRLIDEQFNVELVLRFLILRNLELNDIKSTQDLGVFITDKMIEMCQNPNYNRQEEQEIFKFTFSLLNEILGSDSFKRYNSQKSKFEGSFLISGFEAVGIALGRNYVMWQSTTIDSTIKTEFINKVQSIWINSDYQARSGTGVNVTRRVPYIIPIGQRILVP